MEFLADGGGGIPPPVTVAGQPRIPTGFLARRGSSVLQPVRAAPGWGIADPRMVPRRAHPTPGRRSGHRLGVVTPVPRVVEAVEIVPRGRRAGGTVATRRSSPQLEACVVGDERGEGRPGGQGVGHVEGVKAAEGVALEFCRHLDHGTAQGDEVESRQELPGDRQLPSECSAFRLRHDQCEDGRGVEVDPHPSARRSSSAVAVATPAAMASGTANARCAGACPG